MEVIRDLEIIFCGLGRATQYNGAGRRRYSLSFKTTDKATKKALESYHFNVQTKEDEETEKVFYQARIYANAYAALEGTNGQQDDFDRPLDPPLVQLANGEPVDPDTVGAGSICHIAFKTYQTKKMDNPGREIKRISVKKWVKRTPTDDNPFEEEEVEIVEEAPDVESTGGEGDLY